MSRSAAARTHDRALRTPHTQHGHNHAPAAPRRVSGPSASVNAARPARARIDAGALAMADGALVPSTVPRPRVPSRPPLRLAAGGASLVLRVVDATVEVSGSRTMDRLVRSRAWVVIVAFGLIGIVAMQVSMLKLNNGIGRAVETAATLERSNATMRADVSRLSSGDRVQAIAGQRGFTMPEPADVTYLRASGRGSDARRAAQRMTAPSRELAGPAGSAVRPDSVMPTLGASAEPGAPATAAPLAAAQAHPAAPPASSSGGVTTP